MLCWVCFGFNRSTHTFPGLNAVIQSLYQGIGGYCQLSVVLIGAPGVCEDPPQEIRIVSANAFACNIQKAGNEGFVGLLKACPIELNVYHQAAT